MQLPGNAGNYLGGFACPDINKGEDMTTIYTVTEGKLCSAEARETEKMFIILDNNYKNFGWRTNIRKDQAHLTPESAISYALDSALIQVESDEKRLQSSKDNFALIERLKADI